MNTVKYLKNKDIYYKVFEKRYIVVFAFESSPGIEYFNIEKAILPEDEEIEIFEFYDKFKEVQQRLEDLLLDVKMIYPNEFTRDIARLVRNYDHNYMYIESMSQLKMVEQNNAKIKDKLKELGVKSFEGVVL